MGQTSTPAPIFFDLDKDPSTGGLQLCIGDDNGGYRIAGPKYSGNSKRLQRHQIDEHDAEQIRAYLSQAFPSPGDPRDAVIRELVGEVVALAVKLDTIADTTDERSTNDLSQAAADRARALLSRLGLEAGR